MKEDTATALFIKEVDMKEECKTTGKLMLELYDRVDDFERTITRYHMPPDYYYDWARSQIKSLHGDPKPGEPTTWVINDEEFKKLNSLLENVASLPDHKVSELIAQRPYPDKEVRDILEPYRAAAEKLRDEVAKLMFEKVVGCECRKQQR